MLFFLVVINNWLDFCPEADASVKHCILSAFQVIEEKLYKRLRQNSNPRIPAYYSVEVLTSLPLSLPDDNM